VSKRENENESLRKRIQKIHQQSDGSYGSPRIAAQLKIQGEACSRHRVAKLMQEIGVFGCAKRKFKVLETTNSKHNLPISSRKFKVEDKESFPKAPNQVWVSDTTYIPTHEGWLYLTIQLDVFTRKVVGYSLSDHLKSEIVWESMREALRNQDQALTLKEPSLLAHSDRGGQYASELYRGKLKQLGITQSMSRSGNCYDNAYAESFFHSLKVELIHRRRFQTRRQAEEAIRTYIDDWYNPKRLHSGLDYQTPMDYEKRALVA
jgi:transposase InsO family protein